MRPRPTRRPKPAGNDADDVIEAFHSSSEAVLEPRRLLHVGTLDQARMRGGSHLHRVTLNTRGRMPRLRDGGSWSVRTLMRHATRHHIAVYLNRHEGIPLEEFEAARLIGDIDRMPDSAFRRIIPSASDSWIVLNQEAVLSIERIEWEWKSPASASADGAPDPGNGKPSPASTGRT